MNASAWSCYSTVGLLFLWMGLFIERLQVPPLWQAIDVFISIMWLWRRSNKPYCTLWWRNCKSEWHSMKIWRMLWHRYNNDFIYVWNALLSRRQRRCKFDICLRVYSSARFDLIWLRWLVLFWFYIKSTGRWLICSYVHCCIHINNGSVPSISFNQG